MTHHYSADGSTPTIGDLNRRRDARLAAREQHLADATDEAVIAIRAQRAAVIAKGEEARAAAVHEIRVRTATVQMANVQGYLNQIATEFGDLLDLLPTLTGPIVTRTGA